MAAEIFDEEDSLEQVVRNAIRNNRKVFERLDEI